jgi:hypothetical protein
MQPQWTNDVPFCSENCEKHDGKRCEILGSRAPDVCEPAVKDYVQASRSEREMSKHSDSESIRKIATFRQFYTDLINEGLEIKQDGDDQCGKKQ